MEIIWKKNNNEENEKIGTLYYYDCGHYIGYLFENEWSCYHILSRTTSEDGNILEIVEKMPEDWVPKNVFSIEDLDIYEKTETSFKVKGWSIELPRLRQEQERVNQQPQLQSQSQLREAQAQGRRGMEQGKGMENHMRRNPRTYNTPSSPQEQPRQRQLLRGQHQPSQRSYHQPHTSYSQQKSSSPHQQKKSHQPRRETTQPLSQYKNNTGEAASPLSSSDSAFHERHQSQRQSQRERQMSQSAEVGHSGPQWTSLQSLLSSPTLTLPHVASPKPAPRPLLPTPSSEYPSIPAEHSHGQRVSHPRKSKHSQRPVDSSKQRPRHHVSPQSVPQGSPSM